MNCSVRRVVSLSRVSSLRSYATSARKLVDIPFQPKLANAVNLIGEVDSPIQFQDSPDGDVWAATVIKRQDSPSSAYLSIPVIFHGDLAHSAKCYLKQNDFIHIAGYLTSDPPYLEQHQTNNLQLMVQTLNFVKGYPQLNTASSISASAKKNPDSSCSSWTDLLDNPSQWSDFRDSKLNGLVNPKHPDFKCKDGNVSLWLNNAPLWVSSKLEGLDFGVPVLKSKKTKDSRGGDESWNDLVQNPAKWWDNRLDKRNGKAPDFKHKETGEGLWLDSSPSWVSSKLPPPKA